MWGKYKFRQYTTIDKFISLSGGGLLFVGFIASLDWIFSLDIFSRLYTNYRSASPASATFFIICGLFLLSSYWKSINRIRDLIFLIVIALYSFHGLAQFFRFVFQQNQLFEFIQNPANEFLDNFPFIRMSPSAGLLIFVSGIALWVKCLGKDRSIAINIVCALGIIVGVSGFIALLGYIFKTPLLYPGNLFRLEPASTIAFLLLGSGLVALAGSGSLFLRQLTGSTGSARVLRVILPLIVSILLLQGILNVLLINYYQIDPPFLMAWLTVFSILLSIPVTFYVTKLIFQIAEKADKERKAAEESLSGNEKKYRYLFESNPQPMWIYDTETLAFLEVNDYAIQHYGYSRDEFLSMTLKDIRPHEDESILLEEIKKTSNEFYRKGDWRHKKKNGEIIFVEINAHLIDYEGKPARLVLATDITKRKIVENTLKESEAQFRELFDEAPLGYHELDLEGRFVRVNQTESEMLGYSKDEILGKYAWEFIVDQEFAKQAVFSKLSSKKSIEKNFERIMVRKDGTTFPVLMKDLIILDNNGKCVGIRTAVQDITERKKSEIEIQRINKELVELNATKDKFFSIIGHDLRGPIGGFKSLIEMMISNFDLTDTAMLTRALKVIQSSASSTFELLENLLVWARSQRDEIEFSPEYVNLNEITALVMKPLKSYAFGKQINIINNLAQNQYVYADSNMLMTILRNLISNSIKFTHPGKNVYLSAFENENYWTISVKDEGIGIKPENLHKIFDSSENFTTSGTQSERGSGLGLMLCQDFVKKHGGKIWVVNGQDEHQQRAGSEFQFILPKPVDDSKLNPN